VDKNTVCRDKCIRCKSINHLPGLLLLLIKKNITLHRFLCFVESFQTADEDVPANNFSYFIAFATFFAVMVYSYESAFPIKNIKNSVGLVTITKTEWFREITHLYFEKHVTHINNV
jgi:hypothetical protein